ncbi:hypothetical protein SAMN04487963_1369 [Marinobacter zhejiangensis]|uniref:CAAX prenyl protease 2/Lysostaphin resistance protein A-like domain-containing protein n=2 Tax=Marinobacter zhejiangensis TaxID=488535 RepID=A0A1I4NGV4_9GAMM|nr:hypothetical protein SAMN04487963_1369 [Marinobacter zhejiangensis]
MLAGPGVCALLFTLLMAAPVRFEVDVAQWRLWLWLVVIYPVVEEYLFRGRLQTWLMDTAWGQKAVAGLSLANVVTSLLFSGLHFFSHPPLWALMVLFPSLLFGWFRDRHQSVRPAFVLHAWYNFVYFSIFGLPVSQ